MMTLVVNLGQHNPITLDANSIISGRFRNFHEKSPLFQFSSALPEEFSISVQFYLCSKLLNKLKKVAQNQKIPQEMQKKIEKMAIFLKITNFADFDYFDYRVEIF